MTAVLLLMDGSVQVDCRHLTGSERVGEAALFEVTGGVPEDLDRAKVLGTPCTLEWRTRHGERVVCGIVTRVSTRVTSRHGEPRQATLTIQSPLGSLELRRRTFVHQKKSVPDIVRQVLTEGGYKADDVIVAAAEAYPPREYVTQYDETDAAFVRRLCEEEGLYFRVESHEGRERFFLEDTSKRAPDGASTPLRVAEREGAVALHLRAYDCRETRRRRAGHATVRDFDPAKPALKLESMHKAGTADEQRVEVYEAPGGFRVPDEGKRRARLLLESLRAEARTLTFRTNAVGIGPGTCVELEPEPTYTGAARPTGKWFVVAVKRAWSWNPDRHETEVLAIPLDVPYRLPRVTPRPLAPGVHSAIVTGSPGEEIHTDKDGHVFVRFPWDREGPTDDKSSLPVRVLQPSMPGSMVLPRVGWEVWVMFEDGDPDRPYVLGRTYNGRHVPPVALPRNRSMTSLETLSSPGANVRNAITFDDAAGRQHMVFHAGALKSTRVDGDAVVQTAKIENVAIGGNLSRTVGAEEKVSVHQAYLAEVDSQTASVGAAQSIFVKGNFLVKVGSETVTIGASLLEQVGDPVVGAANLAKAAALHGVGALGKAGAAVATGAGIAMGAIDGYAHGGLKGAAQGLASGGLGAALGRIPGGDALAATLQTAASPAPWHDPSGADGAQQAGGGAGKDAKDKTGAAGPGPGHRDQIVKGAMTESIAASCTVATPGSIGWKTTGLSSFIVGGSHVTQTASAKLKVSGASTESLGALHVKSGGTITRVVNGSISTTIDGALKSTTGGPHNLKVADTLTIKVGGSLEMTGAHVSFVCGGAKVSASPGGVLIEADTITVQGDSKQSSKTTHL